MAYKIKNIYKDSHIMDLNMMGISHYKKKRISGGAIFTLALPLIVGCLVLAATVVPGLEFFAECQNIPGGDICSISIK